MTCRVIPAGPGITAVVCGRGSRPKPCFYCKAPSVALCDFRLPDGAGQTYRTCDRPMCERHRKAIAKNVDHCAWHTDPKNANAAVVA